MFNDNKLNTEIYNQFHILFSNEQTAQLKNN